MIGSFKRIALLLAALALVCFVVFVVGQTAQVVELADRVDPTFGTVVLWTLLATYAVLVAVPVLLFLRLPESLAAPSVSEGPEFDAHLAALRKRLARNPHVEGRTFATREDVEAALGALNAKSDEIVKQSAGALFLSTAISQSGRLDAFVVLVELTRMIWRIAHLYSQRPSVRDMTKLYGNVAGTAFVAGQLEDIDISQQIAPLLASATGGLSGAIPGFEVGAAIVANSVMTGAANAFLTLRVGIITRRYCGTLVVPEKSKLRRAASAEAAKLLGAIVRDGSAKISKTTIDSAKSMVGRAVSGAATGAAAAGKGLLRLFALGASDDAPGPTTAAPENEDAPATAEPAG